MANPPPFPGPFAIYGFCAFLTALLALGDWLVDESIVLMSIFSIFFLGVAVVKYAKNRNTESEISVPDALNLGFAKFTMRLFIASSVIGTFFVCSKFHDRLDSRTSRTINRGI